MTDNERVKRIRAKAEELGAAVAVDINSGAITITFLDLTTVIVSRGKYTTAARLLSALDLDRLIGHLKTMVGTAVDGDYDHLLRHVIVQMVLDEVDKHFGRLEPGDGAL